MILIVPDKFKGSLRADEVADAIESALRRTMVGGPRQDIVKVPMADGGDGSLEVMEQAMKGCSERVRIDTFDALMRPLKAPLLVFDGGASAFIEMAKICGLAMLSPEERNPEVTTTYGLGLAMVKAASLGCRKIVVAIGGSSTNDGGEGLLRAVKEAFSQSALFTPNGEKVDLEVACDVDNPLLGPNGATMVYGPQKGADPAMLERLERRMRIFAEDAGLDTTVPGGGAAGGVGAALHSLGAVLTPGWQVFSTMVGLEEKIAGAEKVITAEGRFDSQSLCGKLIDGVLSICRKYGKKPIVVCGQNTLKRDIWKKAGIGDVFSLFETVKVFERCIKSAASLLSGEDILIAGCDEAGRGPLAGPVFAAAVILPEGFFHPMLKDSKKMTEAQRNELRTIIEKEAVAWAVTAIDAAEIDRINILNASIKGMQESVRKLTVRPDLILVDGNRFSACDGIPYHTVVKGDAELQAIAAASVLAKTHRDEYMRRIAEEFPQYGWDRNMAYPTKEHREAIQKYGLTKYHRRSFHTPEEKELF
ncbi:MAG: ribonuclease HII [Bacteroidales bacterium]|nr:ribonuclease HII [Candidatus Cacconaster merdequi]